MSDSSAAAHPSRGLSPRTLTVFRLTLTALTLGTLGWYVHSRPGLDLAKLQLRWGFLILACASLPLQLCLRAEKWRHILSGAAPDATFLQAFRSYLGALSLGMVTPGKVGELSRGLYLPQPAVRGWRGAGLVMLDNWIDTLTVLAWACLGWTLYFGWRGLGLGLGVLSILAPIRWWLKPAARITHRLPMRWGLREWARNCLTAAGSVPAGHLVRAFLIGLVAYGFEWLQFYCLLSFLIPVTLNPLRLAGLMALVSLANTFQVTLAGLGVREGMAMMLLGGQGVASEPAVMAAFLQSVLVLFLPAVAGLAIRPAGLSGARP